MLFYNENEKMFAVDKANKFLRYVSYSWKEDICSLVSTFYSSIFNITKQEICKF